MDMILIAAVLIQYAWQTLPFWLGVWLVFNSERLV